MTLEPLSRDHVAELRVAADDGELWRAWYTSVPHPDAMSGEVDRRLSLHAEGQMLPWAIRLASTGRVVGMTTFMNPSKDAQRVEIGSTWLKRSAQVRARIGRPSFCSWLMPSTTWRASRWNFARTGITVNRGKR